MKIRYPYRTELPSVYYYAFFELADECPQVIRHTLLGTLCRLIQNVIPYDHYEHFVIRVAHVFELHILQLLHHRSVVGFCLIILGRCLDRLLTNLSNLLTLFRYRRVGAWGPPEPEHQEEGQDDDAGNLTSFHKKSFLVFWFSAVPFCLTASFKARKSPQRCSRTSIARVKELT